jgi:hypothetical protein
MMKSVLFIGILSLLSFPGKSQVFKGNFQYQGDDVVLTLQFQQQGTQVSGYLRSSTGAVFEIQGEAEENVAVGTCTNQDGGSYFEAYLEGDELSFGLIQPDAENNPDYSTAQYILFNQSAPAPAVSARESQNPVSPGSGMASNSGNEIGDPLWGFNLSPPDTWLSQKNESLIVLGHNTIAGMIVIFPHTSADMDAMYAEMLEGIDEDGSYLRISDQQIMSKGNNLLMARYEGHMNGEKVKARGYGILSPYGGGAYLIAIATPDKLGDELLNTAEQCMATFNFFKPAQSPARNIFVGKWTTMTKNTQTDICFCADGSYQQQYESSYSGEGWGQANDSGNRGRWSVTGDKDSGELRVILENGKELIYNYRTNNQGGNEYYFNRSLFFRNN